MTTLNKDLQSIFKEERLKRNLNLHSMSVFLEIPYTSYRLFEETGSVSIKYLEKMLTKVGYKINLVRMSDGVPFTVVRKPRVEKVWPESGEKKSKKKGFISTILGYYFNKK